MFYLRGVKRGDASKFASRSNLAGLRPPVSTDRPGFELSVHSDVHPRRSLERDSRPLRANPAMGSSMGPPFLAVDYQQHIFDFAQLPPRPPGCPGIQAGQIQDTPNALPLPCHLQVINVGGSQTHLLLLTSKLLRTAPPTLPTRNADTASGGNGLPPSP